MPVARHRPRSASLPQRSPGDEPRAAPTRPREPSLFDDVASLQRVPLLPGLVPPSLTVPTPTVEGYLTSKQGLESRLLAGNSKSTQLDVRSLMPSSAKELLESDELDTHSTLVTAASGSIGSETLGNSSAVSTTESPQLGAAAAALRRACHLSWTPKTAEEVGGSLAPPDVQPASVSIDAAAEENSCASTWEDAAMPRTAPDMPALLQRHRIDGMTCKFRCVDARSYSVRILELERRHAGAGLSEVDFKLTAPSWRSIEAEMEASFSAAGDYGTVGNKVDGLSPAQQVDFAKNAGCEDGVSTLSQELATARQRLSQAHTELRKLQCQLELSEKRILELREENSRLRSKRIPVEDFQLSPPDCGSAPPGSSSTMASISSHVARPPAPPLAMGDCGRFLSILTSFDSASSSPMRSLKHELDDSICRAQSQPELLKQSAVERFSALGREASQSE